MQKNEKRDCYVCGGAGWSMEGGDCRACKGTGKHWVPVSDVATSVAEQGNELSTIAKNELTLEDVQVYPIGSTGSWAWKTTKSLMGGSAYPSEQAAETAAQLRLDAWNNRKMAVSA